jgi:Vitamin K-dependent gamma-carboxylase
VSCFGEKVRTLVDTLFGVDTRALAAMRIALAGVVLVDLVLRLGDVTAFYTDRGVFPRHVARAMAPPGSLALYFLAGGDAAAYLLLAIHGLAAMAMFLGLRTRFATIVTWVLTVSLHSRNPLILQGADDLLRLLLFWSTFLPLGARWSLDARRTHAPAPPRLMSVGTAALLGQVALLYAMTSVEKTGAEWRDGSALWVVLSHDHFGKPWAQAAFLSHPELLRRLCRVVLWVERLAPILLFAPFRTRTLRVTGLVALVLLQTGFGAMLYVAHFPWVSVVALVPFVPGHAWDALERWFRVAATRPANAPPPVALRDNRWGKVAGGVLAGAAVSYVLAWSVAGLVRGFESPLGRASPFGVAMGFDATWAMFAPEPARDSGWFVMPGHLADGTTVDLFPALPNFQKGLPVTYDKPSRVFEAFPGSRWLDYLMDLTEDDRGDLWAALCGWMCCRWNEGHDASRRLAKLEITFVLEEVTAPGAPRPRSRRMYFRHECRRIVEEAGASPLQTSGSDPTPDHLSVDVR